MRQGSEEWLEYRRNHIGASEAGVIMRGNEMQLYELWERKLGLRDEVYQTSAMRRGLELEGEAREWFSRQVGKVIWPAVLEDAEYPFLSASLDGISLDKETVVEIKCPTAPTFMTLAKEGNIFEDHCYQMQQQMRVSGVEEMFYVVYHSPEEAEIFTYSRDTSWFGEYLPKAQAFWEHVINRVPPIPERDDVEFLKAEERMLSLLEMEENIKEQLKTVEEAKKVHVEYMRGLTRDCSVFGRELALLKQKRRGSVDYKSIPELEGVDLDDYRKEDIIYWQVKRRK